MLVRSRISCGLVVAMGLWCGASNAQHPPPPSASPAQPPGNLNLPVPLPQDDANAPTPTLHVYTNLAQIPTLILSPTLEPPRKFDTSKLRIRLDSGTPFKPTYVRLEGNDPISLAILIDVTKPDLASLASISDAIAGVSASLNAEDRVSIYATDCSLIRSLYNSPADSGVIRHAVDAALQPVSSRQASASVSCEPAFPLWDSLTQVGQDLSRLPGRRVVLAVTGGKDSGSSATWKEVGDLMERASITMFGLLPDTIGRHADYHPKNHMGFLDHYGSTPEDPFDMVCQLSGGVETFAGKSTVAAQLVRITQMIRGRYIVEFPRGNNDKPGTHLIEISLPHTADYIHPAGISVPIMDPKLLADPMTLPNDTATPEFGKRKIVQPDKPPPPPA